MKDKIIKIATIYACLFAPAYLIASFVLADLNPFNWEAYQRGIMAFLVVIIGALIIAELAEKNKL